MNPGDAANVPGSTSEGSPPMPAKGSTKAQVACTCLNCGALFIERRAQIARGKGKYCSRDCWKASLSVRERASLLERFTALYRVTDGGCWRWIGYIDPAGYGRIRIGGRSGTSAYAHRVSYALHKGAIAESMETDHLCRNRWCVNPDHLEEVSHQENIRRRDDARKAATARQAAAP
jgi:hypothetical protein